MNDAMFLGFLDEVNSITKTAQQPEQEQDSRPMYVRALDKAKSVGGELLPQLAVPLVMDAALGGRSPTKDLTALAEKIRHPSLFKGHIAEGARGMFLGPRSEPGHELLPAKGNRGPVNLAKHLWKTKGTRMGQLAALGLVTVPTIMSAKDLLNKEDPTGQGRSRLSRALEFGGTLGGGILGATSGATGGTIMSMAGGAAGRGLGALADYVRGYSPQPENYGRIRPITNELYSSQYSPRPESPVNS